MDRFFGTYQRFETSSHREGSMLLSADNLIGDAFDIEIDFADGERVAWLVNKFGTRVGFFNAEFSRKLGLLNASDSKTTAFLSFVAYTETEEGGSYWGEAAIVSRETRLLAEFEPLINWISEQLKSGVRPRIDLDRKAIDKYFESNLTWRPEQTLPLPRLEKGSVLMKHELSIGDRVIEAGRRGNIGCYALTWVFFIGLAALLILLVTIFLF